ncbi:MAG: class I SAM-dependent methyltransferase [Candidatus Hydrogenedentes bacterium]|nr:class I SAM-dependent methyltransferase [Candidatus Hydrogenedentota bacterium]
MVIDVGGGRSSRLTSILDHEELRSVISLDVSLEELRLNFGVRKRCVADMSRAIPMSDNSIAMMVSRSVVEHMMDVNHFLEESYRVMEPGGVCIHFFPSSNSPFALVNRALPNSLTKKLIHAIYEESKGICGFPAHYDQCTYSKFRRAAVNKGFEIEEVFCGYHQSHYFGFFLPAFVLFAFYDWLIYSTDQRALCAYLIFVMRKPALEK